MLFGKELREAYQALSILQRELREEKEKNSQLQQHITEIQTRGSAMTAPADSLESDSDSDVIDSASNIKNSTSDIQHAHKHAKQALDSPSRHFKQPDAFLSNQNNHLYSESELQDLEFFHLKSDPSEIASEELLAQFHIQSRQLIREKEANAEKINAMQQQLLQSEYRVLQSQHEQAEVKQVCAQLLEQLNASKHSNVMQLSDLESHKIRWEQNESNREQQLVWQHRIKLTRYKQQNAQLGRKNSALKQTLEHVLCKVEDCEGNWMRTLQTLRDCMRTNKQLEERLKQSCKKEDILTQNWRKVESESSKWKTRVYRLQEEVATLYQNRIHLEEIERNKMFVEELTQNNFLSAQTKRASLSELNTLRKEMKIMVEKYAILEGSRWSESVSIKNERKLTDTIKQLSERSHQTEERLSRLTCENEKIISDLTRLKSENLQLRNTLSESNETLRKYQCEQNDRCQNWDSESRNLKKNLELVIEKKNDLLLEEESLRTQWMEATESLEQLSVEHIYAIATMEVRTESLERQLLSAEETPTSENWTESNTMGAIQQFSVQIPLLQAFLKDVKAVIRLFQSHKHIIRQLCDHTIKLKDVDSRAIWQLLKWSNAIMKASEPFLTALSTSGKRSLAHVKGDLVRLVSIWHSYNVYESECEEELPPVPPFTIKSQECVMILQNWTSDRKKQARVQRWLYKVSTESLEEFGRTSNTILLDNMTEEVKDAFCMLLIPILRQNSRIRLSVYTRQRQLEQENQRDGSKWIHSLVWDMKIGISWNDTNTIESETEISAPFSPANSTHSSTLSTSSSSSIPSGVMLGIIEARLKQLQS